jgi:hypothetical protein
MVITTHELQTSDVRHLHCSDPRVADEVAKRSTDRCTGLTRAFQRCATSCPRATPTEGRWRRDDGTRRTDHRVAG